MRIKVNFPMMEAMQKEFLDGANELESIMGQVRKQVQEIESEGLKGLAGSALCDALEGPLQNKLKELREKFLELADDVKKAAEFARQADQDSATDIRN